MDKIELSAVELTNQAASAAAIYMQAAVHGIDEQFGNGYAKQHPELVAAFMQVAADDFDTNCWVAASQDRDVQLSKLADAAVRVADGLSPLLQHMEKKLAEEAGAG